MKTLLPLSICVSVSCVIFGSAASAEVLIYDDFGLASDPDTSLNGRSPEIGPNNWLGYSGAADVGWKVYGGEALLGTASSNGMAGISMGTDYFTNNPGIYSLSANLSMTSSGGNSWYGIGFNEAFSTGSGTGFYNPGAEEGQPWMFVRNNGELQVRYNEDDYMYSGSGFDVTDIDLELILNTSLAQWTVDAFVNGVQLDLNGGGAGSTYTYGVNPSTIASVGLSATTGVSGTISEFSLQTVPEPNAYTLILGASVLGLALIRRRRRV